MDDTSRAFLLSVENEQPNFDLIGLPAARELPGVKRKLHNLARRSAQKRHEDGLQLNQALARFFAT
jgi:hypothetical protein